MAATSETPPTALELARLLPRVLHAGGRIDRRAALTLYLFLPVRVGRNELPIFARSAAP